jgi:hypothetical protein
MQPSSTVPPPSATLQASSNHVLPASSIPTSDAGNNSGRSFSGYVGAFGNQKRYASYPGSQQETTIPYLSTKLQQQARRTERQR